MKPTIPTVRFDPNAHLSDRELFQQQMNANEAVAVILSVLHDRSERHQEQIKRLQEKVRELEVKE